MTIGLVLAASYLLGAIPTSWLAARLGAGIDLRHHGSKNLGATNVYRVLGWRYAVPVGLLDVAKGAAPVLLLAPVAGTDPRLRIGVGLAAILGHVFSVFVGFRGGKGVATAAGVVLALAPEPLGVAVGVWLLALKVTGYVSLASMVGAVSFPFASWVLRPHDPYTLWAGFGIAAFIVYTHRTNVRRLVSGTESRFGRGSAA